MPYLENLRFHLVGYGCTTCIGNSGPLPEPVASAVKANSLVVAAVLSGNRNFEGRINPLVRANYLASPPLVVAYALAGRMDIDLQTEPLGHDQKGQPVYLRDVWPSQKEVMTAVNSSIRPEMFRKAYEESLEGDERWKSVEAPSGDIPQWDETSTPQTSAVLRNKALWRSSRGYSRSTSSQSRRFRHHGSHSAGRFDSAGKSGRQILRTESSEGLQFLRRAARKS